MLLVLVLTRLMKLDSEEPELILTEVAAVSLPTPPEPEEEQEETPQPEEIPETPPPPSIEAVNAPVDLSAPAMPDLDIKFDPKLAVDMFSPDVEPAALPTPRAVVKPVVAKVAKPAVRPSPPRPSTPALKSVYSVGELDGVPSRLRLGHFRWPSSVRDSAVTAVLDVEIDTAGRVRLVNINSITHQGLRSSIPRILSGTRYTVPRKNGVPVKARFIWTLTLTK